MLLKIFGGITRRALELWTLVFTYFSRHELFRPPQLCIQLCLLSDFVMHGTISRVRKSFFQLCCVHKIEVVMWKQHWHYCSERLNNTSIAVFSICVTTNSKGNRSGEPWNIWPGTFFFFFFKIISTPHESAQMPYLTMLTKWKTSCVSNLWFATERKNVKGSSWAQDTAFHQVLWKLGK